MTLEPLHGAPDDWQHSLRGRVGVRASRSKWRPSSGAGGGAATQPARAVDWDFGVAIQLRIRIAQLPVHVES